MYYLYSKKGKTNDDQSGTSSSDGRGGHGSTGPMSVRSSGLHSSSGSMNSRHPYHHRPYSIADESTRSIETTPEGLDRSLPSQDERGSSDDSYQEHKQESKQSYEQARRLLRRRGLEESDFTEEVMQPRRPNRISCQQCNRDIASNDNQHRIICSDREQHVFCKACVVDYIQGWVEGTVHYELRVGKQTGTARGMYSLPCMMPGCQSGCLRETSMQPLLPSNLFMSCRQKLARCRSELSRSRPRGDASLSSAPLSPVGGGGRRGLSPPQPELSSRRQHQQLPHEQNLQSLQQQQQHQFYQEQQFQQYHEYAQQKEQAQLYLYHQHQQHLHQQQLQQQHSALPMPPALRRQSSASIGAGSQAQSIASQSTVKTQKTQKSVRFSIADEDDFSSGSSATSLTTRFPQELEGDLRSEKDEENRRYRQSILQQQQLQLQREQDHETSSFALCQCCYEEVPEHASRIVQCGQPYPGVAAHRFCSKCVRLYVEEWVFGAATYTLRSGPQDNHGHVSLLLPCLHGECTHGGFQDEQVGLALSPGSMEQYRAKINSIRIQKQDDEERLVQMAIRLSLEQEEIKRRVAKLHQEQRNARPGDPYPLPPNVMTRGNLPPYAVNIPETTLSNTSSLTSFNTSFFGASRSLPDMPTGTLHLNNIRTENFGKPALEDQQSNTRERSLHEVEEAMTRAKVRTCPHCQTKFLKDENFCNKLKCPSCKTAICYICRNVIPTQGYEHFCIHKEGGCAACLGHHCPLWTRVDDDNRRDTEEMRARGLDEANRIWEASLLQQKEIRVDVDSLLQPPSHSGNR